MYSQLIGNYMLWIFQWCESVRLELGLILQRSIHGSMVLQQNKNPVCVNIGVLLTCISQLLRKLHYLMTSIPSIIESLRAGIHTATLTQQSLTGDFYPAIIGSLCIRVSNWQLISFIWLPGTLWGLWHSLPVLQSPNFSEKSLSVSNTSNQQQKSPVRDCQVKVAV